MKIRVGFVSNSSTSSFCIYGVYFSSDELANIIIPSDIKARILLANMNKNKNDSDDIGSYDLIEEIFNVFPEIDLEYYGNDGSNGVYVGRNWTSIQDNQTAGEFKKSIRETIKKFAKVDDDRFTSYQEVIEC